jgi:predicted HTH domain antitoxin
MNEKDNVSSILDQYQDKERLEVILRLHKESHISMDEAVMLITGDRNYMATEALKKIKEQLTPYQPYVYTYGATNTPLTFSGLTSSASVTYNGTLTTIPTGTATGYPAGSTSTYLGPIPSN